MLHSLSVIIPVYNVEKFILRCIESLTTQEVRDVSIECLLIDDCLPDRSMAVVDEWLKSYNGPVRFRKIRHQYNQGPSAARNTGIRAAEGEFVFFLDSDDYLRPDSLATFFAALERYPEVDVIDGKFYSTHAGQVCPFGDHEQYLTDRVEIMKNYYDFQIATVAWNKLLRRQFLLDHSMFFVEGLLYEDVIWTLKLCREVTSVLLLPDVTIVYNDSNTASITHSSIKKPDKYIDSFVYVIEHLLDDDDIGCYVEHKLFVLDIALRAIFVERNAEECSDDALRALTAVNRRLFYRVLADGRLILALSFLIVFKPFSSLLRLSFVRRRLYYYTKYTCQVARFFNFLHRKK